MGNSLHDDYRVLVLAPFGKDALLVREVLERSGIPVGVVSDVAAIARCVGGRAGAAIVAEESLDEEGIELLGRSVTAQPPWSDFPIIVLTGGGATTPYTEMMVRSRTPMGNLNLIERPLRPATLISSVRTAIRSRVRQYEIRDHLEEREQVEQELRRAHDELESLVEKRTLTLRKLSARLMRVQDEERRRIARELHDSVGQFLTGMKLNLGQLRRGSSESLESPALLNDTLDLADRAINEVRTISHLLHPPLLDELGFESAARWYVEGFAKRSGIHVVIEIAEIVERLPKEIELALFRVLQEALTNVHRHARAKNVIVDLKCSDREVSLMIQDDGLGVPAETLRAFNDGLAGGIGLAGMRERLAELSGTLEVHSEKSGTMVRATLPTVLSHSGDASSISVFNAGD